MILDPSERYLRQFGNPIAFFIGLDLGMARDYSAIVVNEMRVPFWDDNRPFHVIRWAHRFRLGTKYGDVAREVRAIVDQLPPRPEPYRLYADSTGVGKPVCDQLRDEGLRPNDVTLTAGHHWSYGGHSISLPKALLASTLNVELQNSSLLIAGALPWRDQLVRELEAFSVTRTAAGNDMFNSRTEADHDDFVIALGLSVWGAVRGSRAPKTFMI